MEIRDVGGNLRDSRVLSILSYSQYRPSKEKMNRIAGQYEEEGAAAFACTDGADVIGVIVLRPVENALFAILSIAVDPAQRGGGIGSKLIDAAFARLSCDELFAETDDDAVGFYRSYGFDIESLGEKYPGTVRYRCTLKRSPEGRPSKRR